MDELKKRWQMTALIAAVMMASAFAYLAVAGLLKQSGNFPGSPVPGDQMRMLRIIIFAVAIGDGLFSFIIKGFLLKGADIPQGVEENLIVPVLAQKLQTATIVVMAFCESVAIFGLVLFILTGSSTDFYILLALSLALMVVHFPRLNKWRDFIGERQTASIIGQGKI